MKRSVLAVLLLVVVGLIAPGATPPPRSYLRLPLIMKGSLYRYHLPLAAWPPEEPVAQGGSALPATATPTPAPTATPLPAAPPPDPSRCANLVYREGERLMLNGEPFVFVGINAISLLDPGLPERELPKIMDDIAGWGATMIRIWVRPGDDLDRFERILNLAGPRGLRFVVTLQDYYFYKTSGWFRTHYKTEDLPHIERVVTRFRGRPEIAIWEVMNEPWCGAQGEVGDPNCYRILQAWAEDTTAFIRRLDPCRPISLGTTGVRNTDLERQAFRQLHTIDTVDIVSMHRVPHDWYLDGAELKIAHELGKPIFLGEVYELGYNKDGTQISGDVIRKRAQKLDKDMRKALELGVDGYLLWDYSIGTIIDDRGNRRHFYGVYGYEASDPVGPVIRSLPIPRVPVVR